MTTSVWNSDMTVVHRLSDEETLEGRYIDRHPLGAFLLDVLNQGLDMCRVVATTDDDQSRTYKRLSSVTAGSCECGNPYAVATWTDM